MKEKLILFSKLLLKYLLFILIFVYIFIWFFCLSYDSCVVFAAEDTSIVMNELNNTTSFNVDDEEWSKPLKVYNDKENNFVEYPYGFKLVSIGFDDKRELYIYTCNPKADEKELTATSINIFFDT